MCESVLLSGTLHRWFSKGLGQPSRVAYLGEPPLRFHSRSLLHSIDLWNDGSETRCRVNDAGIKHFVFSRSWFSGKWVPTWRIIPVSK